MAGCDVVRLYVLQSYRSWTFCKRKTRGETKFWIELAAPCTLANHNEINCDDTLSFIIFLTPVSCDSSNRLWRQRLLLSPCSLWRHKQTLIEWEWPYRTKTVYIYRIFIYVLDDNIESVVSFQNLGNLKTNTTKMPVLVLQKLSLLDSSFLGCFIRKIATICSIPWFSTCYISKSSTQWHILLFIVSFVLPYITQKYGFHKIDMDFEIVASTIKPLL